jgi:hypothetical protein
MTASSIGSGILALFLGLQLKFHWAPNWVTVILIYGYCFIYNLGACVVPFVLTAEVFLPGVTNKYILTVLCEHFYGNTTLNCNVCDMYQYWYQYEYQFNYQYQCQY